MGFKIIEGDTCIISTNGVYSQCPLFTLDGKLFAQTSTNGFIRLKSDGSTSKVTSSLVSIETEERLFKDQFGRLTLLASPNTKEVAITMDSEEKLSITNLEVEKIEKKK